MKIHGQQTCQSSLRGRFADRSRVGMLAERQRLRLVPAVRPVPMSGTRDIYSVPRGRDGMQTGQKHGLAGKKDPNHTASDLAPKPPQTRCKISVWKRPGRGRERPQNAAQEAVLGWGICFGMRNRLFNIKGVMRTGK